MFLIIVFKTLLANTLGQQIQSFPIHMNNGYIIPRIEKLQIVNNYNKLLHIINLTEINEVINILEKNSKFIINAVNTGLV